MKTKSINPAGALWISNGDMMCRLFLLIGLAFAVMACNSSGNQKELPGDVVNIPLSGDEKNSPTGMPEIVFETLTHDFGRVVQGEKVTFAYKFKNAGNKDLLIVKISASCGCTVVDYPRDPIPPGENGILYITFNSTAKKGYQNKQVTVMANTQPSNTVLWVKANVVTN
ncbi:MAG: DUF1573 domain-containing protein [Bacteroidia bacterium]|nr:DUF1573 domain-containing protein [Bacteroidia bacterium]